MSSRIVRDLCAELARASTSRLERVALCVVAFLAERDEAAEAIAMTPDVPPMSDVERQRYMDRAIDRFVQMTHGAAAKPD